MSSVYSWPHPGCKALWKFDDNVVDGSGNENHGSGGVESYLPGKFGKSIQLDGNDYFALPYASSLHLTTFTVNGWIKTTSTNSMCILGAWGIYIGQNSYSYYGYHYGMSGGRARLRIGNGNDNVLLGSRIISDGTWHNVVATRDSEYARIYVDGSIDVERASPASPSFISHGPAAYRWAGAHIGTAYIPRIAPSILSEFYVGQVDDLVVDSFTLEPDQVKQLYSFQRGLL
jgi:hypothetical protein